MASNTRWTSFNDDNEHLEDSILLAYLRKQQLEDRLKISRHIDVKQCPRCLHKLNELKQVSATLEVLGIMRSYQHYPELFVDDTYARIQRAAIHRTPVKASLSGTNHRQQPRKSAVRWISLPAAFGLTILFMVAMLVFANLSGKSSIPNSLQGGTSASQNNSTSLPQQQSTPVDASATPVTGPYIEICSTPNNIAHWRLVICGHNFEVGYKVKLFALLGKTLMLLSNVPVDKQGYFKVGWNIVNCGNLPSVIVAHEAVNAKTISARLQNISFESCLVRTHTSRAK